MSKNRNEDLTFTMMTELQFDIKDNGKPSIVGVNFGIPSPQQNKLFAFEDITKEGGLPNELGVCLMVDAFVEGLKGIIRIAHEQGYHNESELLPRIVQRLEKSLVDQLEITSDEMEFKPKGK